MLKFELNKLLVQKGWEILEINESIEFFKKLRYLSTEIVEGYENEDTEKVKKAMGEFALLMMQMDALK